MQWTLCPTSTLSHCLRTESSSRVCVWDRESRMCLKETSHSTGRQRCLPLPLSLSLSVSDLFSLLSERCWLGGTKRKESLKLPPLRETQPFVGVKHCAFEWACSVACFDARRADKSTLHGCGCLWNVGTEQPWDGLAALISRSGCQHPDLVCPIRPCSWAWQSDMFSDKLSLNVILILTSSMFLDI